MNPRVTRFYFTRNPTPTYYGGDFMSTCMIIFWCQKPLQLARDHHHCWYCHQQDTFKPRKAFSYIFSGKCSFCYVYLIFLVSTIAPHISNQATKEGHDGHNKYKESLQTCGHMYAENWGWEELRSKLTFISSQFFLMDIFILKDKLTHYLNHRIRIQTFYSVYLSLF